MIRDHLTTIREAAREGDYTCLGFSVLTAPLILLVFAPCWLLGRLIALVVSRG